MTEEVSNTVSGEWKRLLSALPPADAVKLSGWTLSIGNCSAAEPLLLVCKVPSAGQGHTVEVAPLLLDALLKRDDLPGLLGEENHLKSLGVNTSSFDGTYSDSYGASGMTPEDWYGYLDSIAAAHWPKLIGSVDYLIAQQMASVYLSKGLPLPATDTQVNLEAKRLEIAANGSYELSLLVQSLEDASGKYDLHAWGYEKVGDAPAIAQAILANGSPLAAK